MLFWGPFVFVWTALPYHPPFWDGLCSAVLLTWVNVLLFCGCILLLCHNEFGDSPSPFESCLPSWGPACMLSNKHLCQISLSTIYDEHKTLRHPFPHTLVLQDNPKRGATKHSHCSKPSTFPWLLNCRAVAQSLSNPIRNPLKFTWRGKSYFLLKISVSLISTSLCSLCYLYSQWELRDF